MVVSQGYVLAISTTGSQVAHRSVQHPSQTYEDTLAPKRPLSTYYIVCYLLASFSTMATDVSARLPYGMFTTSYDANIAAAQEPVLEM